MTADIVRKLTEDGSPPDIAYLIMQDKAALRFMGKPKDCQTSILLKPWFNITIATYINRYEFTPVPRITAVLVEFRKRDQPLIDPKLRQWFRDFVVYGYNQWQPTVIDAFKTIFSPKQKSILEKKLKIKNLKPTDLTIEYWIKLFEAFNNFVPQEKKEIIKGAEKNLIKQQQKLKKWHRTRFF